MKRQTSVLLSALLFLLSPARAQSDRTISGVVFESGTGNPIVGAQVSIVGGKVNPDTTDSEGKFSLKFPGDMTPGTKVRIRVVKEGYEVHTNDIAVSSELSIPISLKRLAKASAPSTVIPPLPVPHASELPLINCQPFGTQDSVSDNLTQKDGPTITSFYTDGKEETVPFLRRPVRVLIEPPGETVSGSDMPIEIALGTCRGRVCKITIKKFADNGVVVDTAKAIVLNEKRETCGVRVKMTMLDAAVKPSTPIEPSGPTLPNRGNTPPAILKYLDAKKHLDSDPDQLTLHDLYLTDFQTGEARLERNLTITGPEPSIVNVESTVIWEIETGTEFVLYYIPFETETPEICIYLSDYYEQVLKWAHEIRAERKAPGESEQVSSKGLVFSKRIFIYHESYLSPEQIIQVRDTYKAKGITVLLRSADYLSNKKLEAKVKKLEKDRN